VLPHFSACAPRLAALIGELHQRLTLDKASSWQTRTRTVRTGADFGAASAANRYLLPSGASIILLALAAELAAHRQAHA